MPRELPVTNATLSLRTPMFTSTTVTERSRPTGDHHFLTRDNRRFSPVYGRASSIRPTRPSRRPTIPVSFVGKRGCTSAPAYRLPYCGTYVRFPHSPPRCLPSGLRYPRRLR